MAGSLNLVTGGAGFLGRHIVKLLTEAGERVRVLDPACARVTLPQGVETMAASILEPVSLAKAMEDVENVYHLAAVPHLWARGPSRI